MATSLKTAPARVRAASAAADEHHRTVYPTQVIPVDPPVAPPPPDPVAPGAAPPAAEGAPPAPPAPPAAEGAPPASAPAAPAEPDEGSVEYWRNRFETLQGKYNTEVPQLHQQVRTTQQILAGLGTAPTVAPAPQFEAGGDEALEKLRLEMGEDFVQGMTAAVARILKPQLDNINERLEGYNKKFTDTAVAAVHDARAAMWKYLDREVPGWLQTNDSDPAFAQWLTVVDVFARRPRKEMLQAAYDANDAESVATFFRAFRQEQVAIGASAQPGAGTPGHPAAAPAAPQAPAQPTLETFVAPGRPAAAAPTSDPGKRRWTRDQIRDFYARKLRGEYRGHDAWELAQEQDIVAASNEGRVD